MCGDAGPADWPVIGPAHDDGEITGFIGIHAHLDTRFVSMDDLCRIIPWVAELAEYTGQTRSAAADVLLYSGEGTPPIFLPGPVETVDKALECFRSTLDTSPGLERRDWFPKLRASVMNKRLGPGRRCPHQGAPLGSIPVVDGLVRCPLHGLVWNVATGRLASMG